MNKTILASTAIIASTLIIISYLCISYLKSINTETRPMDRFTVCIQTVMSESRQGGRVIDAEKAKDICVHAKDNNESKK